MMFSRIGRSLSRSSSARTFLHGNGRLGTLMVASRTNACSDGVERILGFLRGYVSSARSGSNGLVSNLPENPRLCPLFSSEAPKKNHENFYLKEKKENPEGNDKRFDSKDYSNAKADDLEPALKLINLVSRILMMGTLIFCLSPKVISFEFFKNKLLKRGLVDHIVVSNKSVAKVYVRDSPPGFYQTDSAVVQGTFPLKGSGGRYQYYFFIDDVESFEEKLEEAQEALGIDPHDYVPVTYSSDAVRPEFLLRFVPDVTLLVCLLCTLYA